jgi:hypothetical protein
MSAFAAGSELRPTRLRRKRLCSALSRRAVGLPERFSAPSSALVCHRKCFRWGEFGESLTRADDCTAIVNKLPGQ